MKHGTVVMYQGARVQQLKYRRTRGFDADQTVIVMPVASFPDGFELIAPQPAELAGEIPRVEADVEGALAGRSPALPRRLRFAGWLVIADLSDDVPLHRTPVEVGPLFVLRVERLRRSETTHVAMIQVTLVDERYFWASRGVLRSRWSFNRVRADGSIALDSVRPDGTPFPRDEVARHVVGSLYRTPQLAAAPAEWAKLTGELSLPRFCPPVMGLGELVRQGKTEDPCLRLDSTVALHKAGDGFVGYAPEGKGANAQSFPPGVILSKRGTGPGYSAELGYADDYLLVVGKERIATVALDDCEPVLVIPARVRKGLLDVGAPGSPAPVEFEGAERVYPLNENTLRALTRGKWGLTELRQKIFATPACMNQPGIARSVTQLLREQAWRYWRIPGVEVEENGARKPGPNAHLLPLLARAETEGGRRLPVTVETYRFHTTHRAMTASQEAEAEHASRVALSLIRKRIDAAAAIKAAPNPFTTHEVSFDLRGVPRTLGFTPVPAGFADVGGKAFLPDVAGVSHEQIINMQRKARLVDRIKEVDAALGDAYEKELEKLFKAGDARHGTFNSEVWELAKLGAEFERGLKKLGVDDRFDAGMTPLERENLRVLDESYQAQVAEVLKNINLKAEALKRTRPRTGPQDKQYAQYVENLERETDTRASVYSAELGIVRTSTLAGWCEEEGVPSQEYTSFLPKPVRIVFGSTIRPRIDAPPPLVSKTQTRAGGGGGAHRVPAELSDEVTWFQRAYRRTANGMETIDPSAIPAGEGTPVPIDLHELVPLEGEGNGAELEQIANELAETRLVTRPKVEGATLILARAWPVNVDGLVHSVEIYTRDTPAPGTGIETKVTVGSGRAPDPNPLRSGRERPRRPGGGGDAARREGVGR